MALTPKQVAVRLQLAPRRVYGLLRKGKLPGCKIDGQWRVGEKELLDLLSGRWKPPE